MIKVAVLRWGHRPHRDARLSTHITLTARALGATALYLSDIQDKKIEKTIKKIVKQWGGTFVFKMGNPWKKIVTNWKNDGGIVIHLTAYGENIQTSDVLNRIKVLGKNILIIVGSKKVPKEFFSKTISDFNVAIGNQPHSECASLAVFLDRLFDGEELTKPFTNPKIRIIPNPRGKTVKDHRTKTVSKEKN